MSLTFTAPWLSLREPIDHRSRSHELTRRVAERIPDAAPMVALDLGGGTGSTTRYLAGAIPRDQRWLVVDHDPLLLSAVPACMAAWAGQTGWDALAAPPGSVVRHGSHAVIIETCCVDFRQVDTRPVVRLFEGRRLVTASALLDLVSECWLRSVTGLCSANRSAILMTLSYDGRMVCVPEDPMDDTVRRLVNQHQRSDKGFGPALGPDATRCAEHSFREAGYCVFRERSDWVLTRADHELQRQLIDGWAVAAGETAPGDSKAIARWKDRRLEDVAAGRSEIVVGHEDVGAWLPA